MSNLTLSRPVNGNKKPSFPVRLHGRHSEAHGELCTLYHGRDRLQNPGRTEAGGHQPVLVSVLNVQSRPGAGRVSWHGNALHWHPAARVDQVDVPRQVQGPDLLAHRHVRRNWRGGRHRCRDRRVGRWAAEELLRNGG